MYYKYTVHLLFVPLLSVKYLLLKNIKELQTSQYPVFFVLLAMFILKSKKCPFDALDGL